jgi:decaprenylphospho-beta-D-ribofuranose 2-oxidase
MPAPAKGHAPDIPTEPLVPSKQVISGWGRYRLVEALLSRPDCLRDVRIPDQGTLICRGEGRSYGDASISSRGLTVITSSLSNICRFDASTGVVVAEAGTTFGDLLSHVVPHGWFPPVTPGTKRVSLGGAVAADVHGKNHHHDGSIGSHVLELDLILADGRRVVCSPQRNAELFWATVGGMGLTGMIATVTLQLIPIETSSISAQHFKAPNLETTFRWLEDREHDDQYTVAWVDCLSRGRSLGRSILIRGHHARRDEMGARDLSVKARTSYRIPVNIRSSMVTPLSARVFNFLYYVVQGRKTAPFLVDYDRFFYPLDMVTNYNLVYGRRGFLQYQFMIPHGRAEEGVRLILERFVNTQRGIYLAVLKRFGSANPGPLSFPDKGYTLALDLPMTGGNLLKQLDEMDDIVLTFGGRVYLAKDARLTPERFRPMYPRLNEWLRVKQAVDPSWRFNSDLASRLGIDTMSVSPVQG